MRLATFNARVETVVTKPFFREPFKKKRCLMPVSGYFEWQDTPDGKQPHYFTARDGSPVLTVAALWDEWKKRESGERIRSCSMIISEPNDFVAEVHDRMPVLLQPEQFDRWLSGEMGVEELKPAPNDYLQRWAVSKRVNSSKADKDDATLIRSGSTRSLTAASRSRVLVRYRTMVLRVGNKVELPLASPAISFAAVTAGK